MNTLTQAARALVPAQSGTDCFDDLEPEAQDSAREHVRKVLEAIRTPSEGMGDVGYEAANQTYIDSGPPGYSDEVWSAMIDAALAEQ